MPHSFQKGAVELGNRQRLHELGDVNKKGSGDGDKKRWFLPGVGQGHDGFVELPAEAESTHYR